MKTSQKLQLVLKKAGTKTLQQIFQRAIYLSQQDNLHNLKAPFACPPAVHHK